MGSTAGERKGGGVIFRIHGQVICMEELGEWCLLAEKVRVWESEKERLRKVERDLVVHSGTIMRIWERKVEKGWEGLVDL